ncbi:MAG TPA: ECF transporter S component [Romboutsia timonensis]|uniref:ECF transporter S component n=1 Tax=Romboutsia timonensis TaxID=1776391 RepID=A0A921T060_9FIRM|nr:ECF transporter S component [Romboutsia timonensis]
MNNKTKLLVLNGLMIALVCMATMVIQIPIPMTEGYVNIGDSIIFVTSILFGPISGMIAGGFGSALADILTGYSHWALFTLLIKGFEGYIVGIIVRENTNLIKNILATSLGVIIMVSGYLLAGTFLQGSFIVALGSVSSNMIQGIVSIIIGIPIASYLLTVKYVKTFKQISSN